MAKKLIRIIPVLLTALICAAFAACNKDGDNHFTSGPYYSFGNIKSISGQRMTVGSYMENSQTPAEIVLNFTYAPINTGNYQAGDRIFVTYNLTNVTPGGTQNEIAAVPQKILPVTTLTPEAAEPADCNAGSIGIAMYGKPAYGGNYIDLRATFAEFTNPEFKVLVNKNTASSDNVDLYLQCTAGTPKTDGGVQVCLSVDASAYMSNSNVKTITLHILDSDNEPATYLIRK